MAAFNDTLRAEIEEKKEDSVSERTTRNGKILNAKDEPEFGMNITPTTLFFKYPIGGIGYSFFTVTNTTSEKQAFKVKSSDNTWFRSKPSVGFIKSGEKVHVRVTFNSPDAGKERPERGSDNKNHVAIFHVAAGDAKTYKEAFAKKAADGVHHFFARHLAEPGAQVDKEADEKAPNGA